MTEITQDQIYTAISDFNNLSNLQGSIKTESRFDLFKRNIAPTFKNFTRRIKENNMLRDHQYMQGKREFQAYPGVDTYDTVPAKPRQKYVEPGFKPMDDPKLYQDLPTNLGNLVLQSTSRLEAEQIRSRIQDEQMKQYMNSKSLLRNPKSSLALMLAGGLTDIDLPLFFLSGGSGTGLAVANKLFKGKSAMSKVGHSMSLGAVAGLETGTLIGFADSYSNELYEESAHIAEMQAFGLLFGTALGSLQAGTQIPGLTRQAVGGLQKGVQKAKTKMKENREMNKQGDTDGN